MKHWDPHKANLQICFKLSFFQNVGTHSCCLVIKIRKLKDKDLGK